MFRLIGTSNQTALSVLRRVMVGRPVPYVRAVITARRLSPPSNSGVLQPAQRYPFVLSRRLLSTSDSPPAASPPPPPAGGAAAGSSVPVFRILTAKIPASQANNPNYFASADDIKRGSGNDNTAPASAAAAASGDSNRRERIAGLADFRRDAQRVASEPKEWPAQRDSRERAAQALARNARTTKTRRLRTLALGLVGFTVGWIVVENALPEHDSTRHQMYVTRTIAVRAYRDVMLASAMINDYYWSLRGLTGLARAEAMKACHQRCAQRLRDCFFTNGGVYIKFGQHMAQLQHLLPQEYTDTMLCMLDKTPTDSYEDVCQTLREDFGGRSPAELFRSFNRHPMASASLAQVHEAVTHSGERVAVKVQHRGLLESSAADIRLVEILVGLGHRVFPDFDYGWLVKELKENLPRELNFEIEAANCERSGRNFAHRTDIVVPAIHRDILSRRVLTMQFMTGVNITDEDGLRGLNLNTKHVAALMTEAFSEQIFLHGFIHCDPHPGNVLVRRLNDSDKPQLVLLDHGLYKEISTEFRLQYAELWRAIIFGDVPGIKKYSELLGAGELYPLFAAVLTRKGWDEIQQPISSSNRLVQLGTAAEKARLQTYAVQLGSDISRLLCRVSAPMLLLFKTNDCLKSIDLRLGSPINSHMIMARYCLKAIAAHRFQLKPTVVTFVSSWFERWSLEWRLFAFESAVYFSELWNSVTDVVTAPFRWISSAKSNVRSRHRRHQQSVQQHQNLQLQNDELMLAR